MLNNMDWNYSTLNSSLIKKKTTVISEGEAGGPCIMKNEDVVLESLIPASFMSHS